MRRAWVGMLLAVLATTACGVVLPPAPEAGVAPGRSESPAKPAAPAADARAALATVVAQPPSAAPNATSRPACQFVMGFAEMRAALGELVGDCTENERPDPASGDSHQRTTRGLLVWRRGDGLVAFTDGARTWARGPDAAIYQRANDERFPWEAAPAGAAAARVVTPAAAVRHNPPPSAAPAARSSASVPVTVSGRSAPGAGTSARVNGIGVTKLGFQLEPGVAVLRGTFKVGPAGSARTENCRIATITGPAGEKIDNTCMGSADEYAVVAAIKQSAIHNVTVDAPGAWTLSVEEQLPGNAVALPQTFRGSRPDATPFFRLDGQPATVRLAVKGTHFIVRLLDANGEMVQVLKQDPRPFDGTVSITGRQGLYSIAVFSMDEWTVTVGGSAAPAAPAATAARPAPSPTGRAVPSDGDWDKQLAGFSILTRQLHAATRASDATKVNDAYDRKVFDLLLQSTRTIGPQLLQARLQPPYGEFEPEMKAIVKEVLAAAEELAAAMDARDARRVAATSPRFEGEMKKLDAMGERMRARAKPLD